MIIYKTTNTSNGKIYIGKSINNDPTYLGSGTLIKRAFKKYGKASFKKEIVFECIDLNTLNYFEKFFISVFNSKDLEIGYNISDGGDGGSIIECMPNKEEIYKRRGLSLKEWNSASENNSKRLSINKNISISLSKNAESRGNIISKAKKPYELVGPKSPRLKSHVYKISQEHRKNLSESLKGNVPSNRVQVSIDGIIFESLNDASNKLGIKLSTLRNRLKSKNYPGYERL